MLREYHHVGISFRLSENETQFNRPSAYCDQHRVCTSHQRHRLNHRSHFRQSRRRCALKQHTKTYTCSNTGAHNPGAGGNVKASQELSNSTPPDACSATTHACPTDTSQHTGTNLCTENVSNLKVLWWNTCHLANVWESSEFWEVLDEVDVAILTETHHTVIPQRAGWLAFEVECETASGGIVALVRDSCPLKLAQEDHPFDDIIWRVKKTTLRLLRISLMTCLRFHGFLVAT